LIFTGGRASSLADGGPATPGEGAESALREHAGQSPLEVRGEWVFAEDGHPGGAAGPQVRLPGAADWGARPLRGEGGVRERGCAATALRTSCSSSSRTCPPSTRRPRSWRATGRPGGEASAVAASPVQRADDGRQRVVCRL